MDHIVPVLQTDDYAEAVEFYIRRLVLRFFSNIVMNPVFRYSCQ